jgi:hypothetical protein
MFTVMFDGLLMGVFQVFILTGLVIVCAFCMRVASKVVFWALGEMKEDYKQFRQAV